MSSKHDRIVKKLAKKFGVQPRRKGVDLITNDKAIKIATSESDLYQSMKQLRRSRKPKKYIVIPEELLEKARKLTKGTGIGIMDPRGNMIKRPRKRSRKT